MDGQALTVHAIAHPLQQARCTVTVPAGKTIAEIVEIVQPQKRLRPSAHVYLNDEHIPAHHWHRVRPKPAATLSIRVVPQGGGGGKNPLRTVLSIAIAIAAPMFGPAVGASLGISSSLTVAGVSVASAIGSGLITVAGNLLINALAPPSAPKINTLSPASNKRDSPTLFIEGARNELRPHQPVPRVLGFHRMVPPLGAETYTESSGGQQYVRQVFTWGYGKLEVSDRRIGDTSIDNFEEIEVEHDDGASGVPDLALYPNKVSQTDLSVALTYAGSWQVQTTELFTDELVVDITFPGGLYEYDDMGKKGSRSAVIECRYRETGSTGSWTTFHNKTYRQSTTSAIRAHARAVLPRGQYDVAVRKNSSDASTDLANDEVFWTALKSITYAPPINMEGVACDAVRMRATGQLTGAIDQWSALCKSVALDWDYTTETWTTRATNNPASLYRLVLQDSANAKAVSNTRINLEALQDWHDFCRLNNLTFNAVIDYETSVEAVLQDIAAAGRARAHKQDNVWTIVIDRPQSIPVQHISPRNAWDYECRRDFYDLPHALRCEFLNEDKDYQRDEVIVYADGYSHLTATKFETLEFYGMTNYGQVHKSAREHFATLIHQTITHSFSMDFESLVAGKGDLVLLSHDVVLAGLGAARVKAVIYDDSDPDLITGIIVDEDFTMFAGDLYDVRIRLHDNSDLAKPVKTVVGISNTLEFETPFENVGLTEDCLVLFGQRDRETVKVVIKDIDRGENWTARITARNYAPQIYAASAGPIPPYESQTTTPPELRRPLPPIVRETQMGKPVMAQTADGSFSPRLVITLENRNSTQVAPIVKVRQTGDTDYVDADIVSATAERIVLENLDDQLHYDFLIAYAQPAGTALTGSTISSLTALPNFKFESSPGPPADPTGVRLVVTGSANQISWDTPPDIDIAGTEIRYTQELATPSFAAATILPPLAVGNSVITPFQVGTYFVRHKDRGGLYSENPVAVQSTYSDLLRANVVELLQEDPGFTGTHDNTAVITGGLALDDASLMEGIYYFANSIDLGEVYISRLLPTLVAIGASTSELMADWLTLSTLAAMSGGEPTDWTARLQIRTTEDDPGGTPAWTAWHDLIIGEARFRAAEFRLVLTSGSGNISPLVTSAAVTVDMPDRILDGNDVAVPAGGMTITFDPPFLDRPSIAVNPENNMSGDRYVMSGQSESGFTIEFFNSAGTSVARTMDWIAKGYGRQQA